MKRICCLMLPILTISAAWAQSFNLDVNAASGFGSGVPSSAFGGAANQPGTWNSVVATGTSTPLVTLSGAASNVSVRIDGTATPYSADDANATGDYARLVEDGFKLVGA